jgi:hypothetical protein
MTGISFVMGLISPRFHDNFAVLRMGGSVFDSDYNGFVHFVTDDDTHSFFYRHWRIAPRIAI